MSQRFYTAKIEIAKFSGTTINYTHKMYTEFKLKNVSYFIKDSTLVGRMLDLDKVSAHMDLLALSDFALDRNGVLKCRYDLYTLVRMLCSKGRANVTAEV